MSYTRDDVFKKMRDNGNYGDADDYRNTCERHGHSMHERVDRFSVEDGASFSHVGDESRRALEDLQADERRKERRQEERARQRRYEQRLECEQEDNLSEE